MGSRGGGAARVGGGAAVRQAITYEGFPENGITRQGFLSQGGLRFMNNEIEREVRAENLGMFTGGDPPALAFRGAQGGALQRGIVTLPESNENGWRSILATLGPNPGFGRTVGRPGMPEESGILGNVFSRGGFSLERTATRFGWPGSYRDERSYRIMAGGKRVGRLEVTARHPTEEGRGQPRIQYFLEGK